MGYIYTYVHSHFQVESTRVGVVMVATLALDLDQQWVRWLWLQWYSLPGTA